MVWIQFLISSAVLVFAATKLAEYGDAIAYRTRLGGMFVGTLLLAGATSLPEFLTTINSIILGEVDLAAGNLFGSNMFNMFMLALLDIAFYRVRLLRMSARKHVLSGSFAGLLIGMVAIFILSDVDVRIGWLGLDSILVMAAYIWGIYTIQTSGSTPLPAEEELDDPRVPRLRNALIGFGLATLVLVAVSPFLVSSSAQIAEITGLSTGFVGTALLAVVTSLPEMVTTIAAARIGAYDLAVGNLFGSNMFNMFALGAADLFYLDGRFLGAISSDFVLTGMIGLVLTMLALVGNVARLERRFLFIELDAGLLGLVYVAGLWLLYLQSTGF
jgi:cation:H+ antiporter